jgi:N6-adenosine-specific RNA methylase IME4
MFTTGRRARRAEQGATVADLEALVAAGKKFGVICPDFPWPFEVYSGKGKQRSAERHYDTWPLERIMAMAPLIAQLAAPDCALLPWAVCPEQPAALEFIKACGFEFKTIDFFWLKTTPNAEVITLDGKGLHWGMGYSTRANIEPVLLATRGSPLRLAADVHQVVIAPVSKHSEKPAEVYRRITKLYGWVTWGNEINRSTWDAMWQQPFGLTDSECREIGPGGAP